MRIVYGWWWLAGRATQNFGELLLQRVLSAFGCRCLPWQEAPRGMKILVAIGSEYRQDLLDQIRASGREPAIWGQGYSSGVVPKPGAFDIRAVRGPLTRLVGQLDPETPVGDPSVFAMQGAPIGAGPKGGLVHAPHWANRRAQAWSRPGCQFFDVEGPPAAVDRMIARLTSAEFVLTSSLHVALVCALAGQPFGLYLDRQAGETINKPLKWIDGFALLGLVPWDVEFHSTVEAARAWYDRTAPRIDQDRIARWTAALGAAFPQEIAL